MWTLAAISTSSIFLLLSLPQTFSWITTTTTTTSFRNSNSRATISTFPSSTKITTTTLNMSSPHKREIVEIKTSNAPAPVGPYCQAILVDGMTLYCSGQIALDPQSGEMVGNGDVQEEAKQALKNLGEVLKAAGTDPTRVVRCTVFLADLKDFAKANEIYSEFFKDNLIPPTRSCVQAAALPKGAQFEVDCIAEL